jgi:hypothetical protein
VTLYAGAVAARPMTTLDNKPIADPLRPLSTGSTAFVVTGAAALICISNPRLIP